MIIFPISWYEDYEKNYYIYWYYLFNNFKIRTKLFLVILWGWCTVHFLFYIKTMFYLRQRRHCIFSLERTPDLWIVSPVLFPITIVHQLANTSRILYILFYRSIERQRSPIPQSLNFTGTKFLEAIILTRKRVPRLHAARQMLLSLCWRFDTTVQRYWVHSTSESQYNSFANTATIQCTRWSFYSPAYCAGECK